MSSNEVLKEVVQDFYGEVEEHLKQELGPDYKRLRKDLPLYEELLRARIRNEVYARALKLTMKLSSDRVVDNISQLLFSVETMKATEAPFSELRARLAEVSYFLNRLPLRKKVVHIEQRVNRVERDQEWSQICKELGREDLLRRESGR